MNWQDRFWQRVDKTGDCWLWTGPPESSGYGQMKTPYGVDRTHRIAYKLAVGPIPDGLFVLHGCDNRLCVNPVHLRLGTPADNARDMVERGRSSIGERHGHAKLTAEQVRAIRESNLSSPKVARIYGVDAGTVRKLRRRERWPHV
jgi:hypothetical protein